MNSSRKNGWIFILLVLANLVVYSSGASDGASGASPKQESYTEQASEGGGGSDIYPPEGWLVDFNEARQQAEKEGKLLLVNFTGSDWCVWCHRLRDEVLSTVSFTEYAKENLVLLFIDSPSSFSLPEKQEAHNKTLISLLGVKGFPTLWLFDSDLTPLLQTGYRSGGAEEYIRHLKEDRVEASQEEVNEFAESLRKEVEARL